MNQASLRPSCHHINVLRDGPLENLWGGGAGDVQKNIRAREI